MKRKLLIFLCCIFLGGCTSQNENVTTKPTGEELTDTTEPANDELNDTTEPTGEGLADTTFNGFTDAGETPYIGNSMSSLNRNGILYNDTELIYGDQNGNLKHGDIILSAGVSPKCINVLDDKIYFINSNDNKIYCFDRESKACSIYHDIEALFFAKTKEYFIFMDVNHALFINRGGDDEMISDKSVAWVDIYGKYIIYSELTNGCQVNAFDTTDGASTKLLDYGFFPLVYGDSLYYQEKSNGYICRLDLISGESSIAVSHWGQQFSFVNDELYFVDSMGIHSASDGCIYTPDEGLTVESLFECGGELFFTEMSDVQSLYKLDTDNGERILIE